MAINHTNCSSESRQFCDQLLAALIEREPTAERHETSTCGFTIGDSNRFAYLYHKTDASLATIFLRGDDASIIPPLSNGNSSSIRDSMTGNWAKEFPQSIHLTESASPSEVANLLLAYSLPLASKKRGAKIGRETLNGEQKLTDGARRSILVTTYERNRTLRAQCLAHHGYKCAGCEILMADIYGSIADAYIHVHHLNPVAATGETIVDPITDLVPLCPNCHSVVHLKSPPITIAELRLLIQRNA